MKKVALALLRRGGRINPQWRGAQAQASGTPATASRLDILARARCGPVRPATTPYSFP